MSGEAISALIGSVIAGVCGAVVIWFAAAALSGRITKHPRTGGRIGGVLGIRSGARVATGADTDNRADSESQAWEAMYAASAPFTLTAGVGLLIAALIAPFLGTPMASGNVILGGVAWLMFWLVSGLARGNRAAKDARPIRR